MSEIKYEAEKHFKDLEKITKQEVAEYEPSEWMADDVKTAMEDYFENNEDKKTLSWDDVFDTVKDKVEDAYNSMNLSDLTYGDATYQDGDTIYVVERRGGIETFNQPDEYEPTSSEEDYYDDLSSDQKTVVNKYADFNKTIQKLRPDAKMVRDENDMEWIETKITDADRTNPIIAFQNEGAKIKGAIDFVADNKATIHIFGGADISTLAHEMSGHLGRRFLEKLAENNKDFAKDYEATKKWANVKDNQWTTQSEEKFARGFEKYLREGKAPTKALESVFNNLKNWLTNIYKAVKGSSIDINLTPEIKSVFDKLLGGENLTKIDKSKNDKNEDKEKQSITLGLTPYAGKKIQKYHTLKRFMDWAQSRGDKKMYDKFFNEMKSDVENRIARLLPKADFTVTKTRGVFGKSEPSFEVKIKGDINDILHVAIKFGEEFDQDAVHVRDFTYEPTDNDVVGATKEDGSAVVPYSVVHFSKGLSDEEFKKVLKNVGIDGGGALSLDGKTALVYNAETFEPNETEKIKESQDKFSQAKLKLNNYDSEGIKVKGASNGNTRLWNFKRGISKEHKGTYEWGKRNIPQSENIKARIADEGNNRDWARQQLSTKVRKAIDVIASLNPKFKDINSPNRQKAISVGKMFDKMPMSDFSKPVIDAYNILARVIKTQYRDLPIKVYPFAKAIWKNGKVEWQPNIEDIAYKGSKEMSHDVDSNNKMVCLCNGVSFLSAAESIAVTPLQTKNYFPFCFEIKK